MEQKPITPNADIASFNTRLRLVEEKAANLNRKIEFLENNFVNSNKKNNETLKIFDSDLIELKRDMEEFKQKLDLIIKELKMTAGKDELTSVQRYLDLWNLTRFITREEVEKMLQNKKVFEEKHIS